MKKLLLAAAVLVIAMAACNEKQSKDSIIGSWVMPIEGQPGKMQGIKLEEGGDASSINMATLVYKYWEQQGDELYLTVKSKICLVNFIFSDFIKIISTKIDIKENVSKRQRIINCSRILFPRLL